MTPQFKRRTATIYGYQRSRAKKDHAKLDYDLAEFRALVADAFEAQLCPYCKDCLGEADWSADHDTPISRGGKHTLRNLIICCQKCNETKGALTAREFIVLRRFLRDLIPLAEPNVLRRLRAGGRTFCRSR